MNSNDIYYYHHKSSNTHKGYFELDQRSKNTKSPLNPWAFIRVCNEKNTLEESLYSILPAIQRGVIGYNDCTDGSEEIIINFCKKFPTFQAYKYPYQISTSMNPPPKHNNKLSTYYNWVKSYIPKGEWMIKIDCDHIYDGKKLFNMFYLIKHDNDVVSIPRINFVIKDDIVFVETYNTNIIFRDVVDHWLIKNDNLIFEDFVGNKLIEILRLNKHHNIIRTELNNYHFPYIKNQRKNQYGNLIRLDDFINSIDINNTLLNRIDISMLNQDFILKIYYKFLKDDNG